MMPALAILAAYLLGSIPFGYLLVRFISGVDIRSIGSGNIGATNVLRTGRRGIAVLTLILDAAKGYCAVWLAARLTADSILFTSLAAVAVLLGHVYPVFLRFKGGKAVASFIGAFLYLAPGPLLAVLLVFVIVVWASRYISLGSMVAAGSFPFGVWLILHPPLPLLAASIAAAVLILYKHQSNLERLRAGTENVFRFSGKAKATR